MWSDNETSDDLFGFRVHADLVRELILDPTVLPATIGIFGDWGGGKSSIMKMLRADFEKTPEEENSRVESQNGVAVLYFNGWLFEGYDDAKAALLSSILTALRDHKKFGPKIKDRVIKLLKQVNYMRITRMLLTGAVVGGVAAATGGVGLAAILAGALAGAKDSAADVAKEGIESGKENAQDEMVADIRQFHDEFAAMLKDSDIKTLVVLIDDLDRCSPDRIIENLEAIKLFFNVPNTAFVIGADRRIIRQAVAWRYRDSLKTPTDGQADSNERLVDDYLEKLIQIPYRLPRLSPSEIETYLTLLFCKRYLDLGQFNRILEASRKQRDKDRYCAFTQTNVLEIFKGTALPAKLSESLRVGSSIASQITDVLQGNPRQVKRFLNAFFLRRRLADVARLDDIKDDILVKLMLLEYAAPALFGKLFDGMNGQTGVVDMFAKLEPTSDAKTDKTPSMPEEWKSKTNWLTMEPRLVNMDLRDYMWVTRDRLGSTMSSATMVPPIIRAVLKQVLGSLSDTTGRKEIHKLQPTERSILAQLLATHAQRTPKEMKAFQALMEIAKIDEPSVTVFKDVITRIPKNDLTPALAIYIKTEMSTPTALGKACQSIVTEYQNEKTPFGKALKQTTR
jgi:predicted KAP-like P-loop ATPase